MKEIIITTKVENFFVNRVKKILYEFNEPFIFVSIETLKENIKNFKDNLIIFEVNFDRIEEDFEMLDSLVKYNKNIVVVLPTMIQEYLHKALELDVEGIILKTDLMYGVMLNKIIKKFKGRVMLNGK